MKFSLVDLNPFNVEPIHLYNIHYKKKMVMEKVASRLFYEQVKIPGLTEIDF